METNSSFNGFNADRKLSAPQKILWLLLNLLSNCCPALDRNKMSTRHFSPKLRKTDWEKINHRASPSRVLSDFFWLQLDWKKIKSELGDIHVVDIGCGSGNQALRLMNFSNGRLASYLGIDMSAKDNWEKLRGEHEFITLVEQSSANILDVIPRRSNFLITQSAIEHFEDDLLFFEQLSEHVGSRPDSTIQVHLFPSAACLKLYPLHGVRQYTPRTVAKIARIFAGPASYSLLFGLGGKNCNRLHFRFITKPQLLKQKDWRESKRAEYEKLLVESIEKDINDPDCSPSFYALLIHSNYKGAILEDMTGLSSGGRRAIGRQPGSVI